LQQDRNCNELKNLHFRRVVCRASRVRQATKFSANYAVHIAVHFDYFSSLSHDMLTSRPVTRIKQN
jgi:hypothetical protein